VILHEDKFNRLKSFLAELVDENVKNLFIRKILNFDREGKIFTRPIESAKDSFIRLIDLLLNDVENYENLQEYLFSREPFFRTYNIKNYVKDD